MAGSVIAAWVGAAASLIGAGLTVWWPWHNRPQADWTLLKHSTHPDFPISATVPGLTGWLERREEKEPDLICSVYNSGDGDAYDVQVEGIECEAYFLTVSEVAGDTEFMTPSKIAQFKASDRLYMIAHFNEDARIISIHLHWTQQLTRMQRRVFRPFALKGDLPEQPRHPIREPKRHHPSMLRYRFEHSRLGLWLYSKFPRWAWRTLVPRPASPTKQEEPSQESPHQ